MTIIVSTVLATALVIVILVLIGSFAERQPTRETPEPDLAAPYREGLHAAIRMQGVAQDLEQQLYAEAMRLNAEGQAETETSKRP